MDLSFISTAIAAEPTQPVAASGFSSLILLAGFLVIFYFFLIRPQAKRAKEHKDLLSNLKTDDEVMTAGGIAGRIVKITDNFVVLAIADNVEITIQKPSISNTLPKGTLKSMS